MHGDGSLFLLLVIGLVLCILMIPVRINLVLEHTRCWQGKISIYAAGFTHSVELPIQSRDVREQPTAGLVRNRFQNYAARTSVRIEWLRLLDFLKKTADIISRHTRMEHGHLECIIGFSRPDITAYSYGFFWAVLSALPEKWLRAGSFSYQPDFYKKRQDVKLKGIIRCRVGQIILIIGSMFRLTVSSMLEIERSYDEQVNRKEQMSYES